MTQTAISGVSYDPYLMAALSSPNYYQLKQNGNAGTTNTTTNTNATTNVTPTEANTTFKGGSKVGAATEDSDSAASAVLGTVALIGSAVLCRKAYKAGSGNGVIEKTLDGVKSWFGKGVAKTTEKYTLKTVSGKKVCSIPRQRNRIHVDGAESALESIGFNKGTKFASKDLLTTTTKDGVTTTQLAKGIEVKQAVFKQGENLVTMKNGKVVKYVDKNGNNIIEQYKNPNEIEEFVKNKKAIDDMITNLNKGDEAALMLAERLKITHTTDDVTRIFSGKYSDPNFEFSGAVTKNFALDSEKVGQMKLNENVRKAIADFNTQSIDKVEGKVASAVYNSKKLGGDFIIKNGEISGINIAGTNYPVGSVKYREMEALHPDEFKDVFKNQDKFENVVKEIA